MKFLVVLFLIINLSIILSETIKVSDIKIGQTHIISPEGKTWNIKNETFTLYVTPHRDTLVLARFEDQSPTYIILVYSRDGFMGALYMNKPNELPPTESNGSKYSTVHHSVKIPKEWVRYGMQFFFYSRDLNQVSDVINVNVGQYNPLKMWVLPFYLFGANDTNSIPFSEAVNFGEIGKAEFVQKLSISEFLFLNHPIGKIDFPELAVAPRLGNRAYLLKNANQVPSNDSFSLMDQALDILEFIRVSFGESTSSTLIYSPLFFLGSDGRMVKTEGGWGGSSIGVGDHKFDTIFVHEIGHSVGLPHAGEDWAAGGNYPYPYGSLKGSEWGYDSDHNELLGTFIPTSSQNYTNCQSASLLDEQGRCIKQSLMQGGEGDQAAGYLYGMFSDFEQTIIQNYFRNTIYFNEATGKYIRYNTTTGSYYDYIPTITNNGLKVSDLYGAIPVERNIDVYTIIYAHSLVSPSDVSIIYPFIKSNGNLLKQFDPTNTTDIVSIIPNTGEIPWYCHIDGCDYTIRVTYEDGSLVHVLLKKGNRKYFEPLGALKTTINDPLDEDSFIQGAINVRANKRIIRAELLDTPFGWNGVPSNSKVLASRSV